MNTTTNQQPTLTVRDGQIITTTPATTQATTTPPVGEQTPDTLSERVQRLTDQGARFQLLPGEEDRFIVVALIEIGRARTFRDGGSLWLELAD